MTPTERLFTAFAARDAETMATAYAPDATFRDPVFDLRGDDIGAMWRGLMRGARRFELDWHVDEDGDVAGASRVRWTASYDFPRTRRPVVNNVRSTIELVDGLISAQTDEFDLWRWSRQALGWPGAAFGWAPPFQRVLRRQALGSLAR